MQHPVIEPHSQGQPIHAQSVMITGRGVSLIGDLTVPINAGGVIVFAHGSGSGRMSPRNRAVAHELVRGGFATLLFDLLTPEEEVAERYTRHLRFDIPLLANRLAGAVEWVHRQQELAELPIGLFGASTGAAAALIASTRTEVAAVVSRGGRPDLAGVALARVSCPTLLIVGGADVEVLDLNRRAQQRMSAPTALHIVVGAGHLFEEPGAMREVIDLALGWFHAHAFARAYVPISSPSSTT